MRSAYMSTHTEKPDCKHTLTQMEEFEYKHRQPHTHTHTGSRGLAASRREFVKCCSHPVD